MTPLTERFATVLAEDDDGFTLFKAESLSYVENSEIPEVSMKTASDSWGQRNRKLARSCQKI